MSQGLVRQGTTKRYQWDRRQAHDLDYFINGGVERRRGPWDRRCGRDRRSGVERRMNNLSANQDSERRTGNDRRRGIERRRYI
ncbi:MAG: hypothetical protein JRI89_16895 [Deltaproteobacteria bacterium]|nr:hypothetical protein [Deltaproteobacteria bacterium]